MQYSITACRGDGYGLGGVQGTNWKGPRDGPGRNGYRHMKCVTVKKLLLREGVQCLILWREDKFQKQLFLRVIGSLGK